jgi:hypothetical protein
MRESRRSSNTRRKSFAHAVSPRSGSLRHSALRSSLAAEQCRVRIAHAGSRDIPVLPYSSEWRSCYDNCSSVPASPRPRALRRSRRWRRIRRNATAPRAPWIPCARAPRSGYRRHRHRGTGEAGGVAASGCGESGADCAHTRDFAVGAAPPDSRRRGSHLGSGARVRVRCIRARIQLRSLDGSRALDRWCARERARERARRGYNDWSLIFPQAIQDLDVIKGPRAHCSEISRSPES